MDTVFSTGYKLNAIVSQAFNEFQFCGIFDTFGVSINILHCIGLSEVGQVRIQFVNMW